MEPLRPKGLEWDNDDATIYASHLTTLLSEIVARKRPIVNCLAHHECANFKTVRANDFNIGKLAAHYFRERGFERFFFYCGRDTSTAAELRSAGFAAVLGEAGHVARKPRLGDSTDRLSDLIGQILSTSKPVALFVSHDHLAREVADALKSFDLRIPEQVAVLGVDNDELQCDISRPPLSSIQVPYEDIGYRAGAVMDDILRGKDVRLDTTLIDPIGVITRQSTAIFAVDDPRLAEALSYIRDHACDPCAVDDVLRNLALSRRWLEVRFNKVFSRTPHEMITVVRMDRARQLLRDPDQTLKEVAQKSGYVHLQNFVSAFRRSVGWTHWSGF